MLSIFKQLKKEAMDMAPFPEQQWPPSVYYRFLGLLCKRLNAKVFVELGTCGGGASYNTAKISPDTKVISIDLDKYQQVAGVEELCPNFEFVRGDSVCLAKTIGAIHKGNIDVLFIDTVHTYERTMAEFNAWLPYLCPGAVVCFDDLNRPGLDRVWRELPYVKTGFNELSELHIGGGPQDGGFGCLIVS